MPSEVLLNFDSLKGSLSDYIDIFFRMSIFTTKLPSQNAISHINCIFFQHFKRSPERLQFLTDTVFCHLFVDNNLESCHYYETQFRLSDSDYHACDIVSETTFETSTSNFFHPIAEKP